MRGPPSSGPHRLIHIHCVRNLGLILFPDVPSAVRDANGDQVVGSA
jgi:hypothetical protein